MTKAIFELSATARKDLGKGASRRLRRLNDEVPAIIYGGKEAPMPVTLSHNKVLQALDHEAFYSHILSLDVDGKQQKAVLKDIQRHPYKRVVMHMDFQRVSSTDVITMRVPLHFNNADTCPGAKAGGVVTHQIIDIEIRCQAQHLPEYLEVDLGSLELDHSLHLSDIELPKGVDIPGVTKGSPQDLTVVGVRSPKGSKNDEEAGEGSTDTEGDAAKNDAKDKK